MMSSNSNTSIGRFGNEFAGDSHETTKNRTIIIVGKKFGIQDSGFLDRRKDSFCTRLLFLKAQLSHLDPTRSVRITQNSFVPVFERAVARVKYFVTFDDIRCVVILRTILGLEPQPLESSRNSSRAHVYRGDSQTRYNSRSQHDP